MTVPLRWRPREASLTRLLARCERAPLTYDGDVPDVAPPGYRLVQHSRALGGVGLGCELDRAADALLTWSLHRAAGMVFVTSSARAEVGTVIVNAAPFGPLAAVAPCRVVSVFDSPQRRGFAYATLPGHPLTGREEFVLHTDDARTVHFALRSVSRPAGPARLAPVLTRAGQHLVNRRYLTAAGALSAAAA